MKCIINVISLISIILILILISCYKVTLPEVTTENVTGITQSSASCGGNVTNNGGANITARGVCWSTSQNPDISSNKTSDGKGNGTFTSSITSLTTNTSYYVRAYATNSAGTSYGSQINFTTQSSSSGIIFNSGLTYGSVTDIDGNVYKTIQIGNQIWLAENLKTTKYSTNASIPYVTDNTAWSSLTTPAYCWYNNNIAYKDTYGALYNWYAVNTRILCPTGWHIPSNNEWTILVDFLGGSSLAGGKMKEIGISHWRSPNTGATNASGFTALPSGYRHNYGLCELIGEVDYGWLATEFDVSKAWSQIISYSYNSTDRAENFKQDGFSIRCIKD